VAVGRGDDPDVRLDSGSIVLQEIASRS
jgi:hypothetical protein